MEKVPRSVKIGIVAIIATSTGFVIIKKFLDKADKAKFEAAQKKWGGVGKDIVILHQFPRPTTSLNLSPYPAKLETFLRLAKIEYICDYDFPQHPNTQKSPWITFNGQDVPDSQLSIELLTKKLGKDLNSHLGPKEKAISKAFRALIEDHLYWIIVYDRYVENQGKHLKTFMPAINEYYRTLAVRMMTRQCYHQGLGRLGKGEIQRMGVETLQTLSTFLGSKLYLMGGDVPSEIDCVLFGFLTTILYTLPEDNTLRIVVEKRLGNLLQFTKRMKNNVYPDWEDIIGKNSLTELKKKDEEKPPARPPPPAPAVQKNAPKPAQNTQITPQPAQNSQFVAPKPPQNSQSAPKPAQKQTTQVSQKPQNAQGSPAKPPRAAPQQVQKPPPPKN